jgi:hypothetical protein
MYLHPPNLQFTSTDLEEFCMEQEIKICAVKLHHLSTYICILIVYRSPTGIFLHFLNNLESILTWLYTNSSNIILCGDINVNYLDDGFTKKQKLVYLLASHNFCGVVNFPTRITNSSAATTDNFFIDKCRNEVYSIYPLSNGLSDHDVQILILNNFNGRSNSNIGKF